ncbi:MAG: outer membrane lipoprotein-sorting protein [Phycisphaerales bacterium]|nr:outer membrane lipoprotein-sorting protein [Phycisphaerales bacterium]
MKKNALFTGLVFLVGSVFGQAVKAETLEDVKKKIHDKLASYQSLHYKLKSVTDIKSPQMTMNMRSDTTFDCIRKGDKVLYRSEQKSKTDQKIAGIEQKSDGYTLVIDDGAYVYSYSEQAGQKSASKEKSSPETQTNPFDAAKSFKSTEQMFNLKLLPDETINGQPTYVIEMTPKNAAMKAFSGKNVNYYDKKTGISVKSVSYDPKGKVVGTITTTDIKINPKVDPSLFVFKAPQGVTVVDNTKAMQGNK